MSIDKNSVKVSIMQREFVVTCTAEERRSVVEAAAYLDKQMRAVSKGARVLGIDRCAIMAGLNISHELLELQQVATETAQLKVETASDNAQLNERMENLHQQIDAVVTSIQEVTH